MASISKRFVDDGSPRYDVAYREAGGKQRTKTFRKRVDAENFRKTADADILRGVFIDPNKGQVAFKSYAERWIAEQYDATQFNTRQMVELRMRLHVYPKLGNKRLAQLGVAELRSWAAWLRKNQDVSATYRRTIYANVRAILQTAAEDGAIARNPATAKTVLAALDASATTSKKIDIWSAERVAAVRAELPEKYRIAADLAAGLGLRQGEVFGLATSDVDFLRGVVTVRRQVKVVLSKYALIYAPLKQKDDGETREVPLPSTVRDLLAAYLAKHPAREVTLPYGTPDGEKVTVPLILSTREGGALNKNYFNAHVWRPTLQRAQVPAGRENGMHALRHRYASVLLEAGVTIKAVSEYLGHDDPAFTLRTYAHVMPTSGEKAQSAVDDAFACWMAVRSEGSEGASNVL